MPLSQTDLDDARRYAGYPVQGALFYQDVATAAYSAQLDAILAGLTDDQITALQTRYLAPLRTLEASIIAAADNLDTDRAAVWYHNKNEILDRATLFTYTRQTMCYSLGIPPGTIIGYPIVSSGSGSGSSSGGGGGGSALAPAVFTV